MMDKLREALQETEKRKLGYIIREYRLIKLDEIKQKNITHNPYTKENFCEHNKLCHYHTLTKLENDVINNDAIYAVFLSKLGLDYQVTKEEHQKNMDYLNNLLPDIFKVIEYIDDNLLESIKNKIDSFDLSKDCIAKEYAKLFNYINEFAYLKDLKDEHIVQLKNFLNFYDDLYFALANHCLGIYHLKNRDFEVAKSHFDIAKKIYEDNHLGKGVINQYYISIYRLNRDFLNMYKVCKEMEAYYLDRENDRRLYNVYDFLTDYFVIHNSFEKARMYYEKNIQIVKNNKELKRFEFLTHYNFGLSYYSYYLYKKALKCFKLAYLSCSSDNYKLAIINKLLILLTILKYDISDFINIAEVEDRYFDKANEFEQIIFKYFKYKYEESTYYRRYAVNQVIPYLKKYPGRINSLLFIYQDLYE